MSELSEATGRQLDAGYYDTKFSSDAGFQRHYTETQYYGLWAVILDRLRLQQKRRILEIGCGPGQLANAIRDMSLAESYLGIDFSQVAIDQARKTNPGLAFHCADVFEDDALETQDYDIVLSTEFLEHVHEDLAVLERVRPKTVILASVPNFPWREHVRHFASAQEVHDRYNHFFEKLYVVPIRMQEGGATHFLMQGPRKT